MPKSLFHKKVLMNEVHKPALKSHLFDQQELSQCIIPAKYPLCSWWGDIIAKTSMDCWKHVWWNMSIPQKYLLNNYETAENITVVFDGYLLSFTKHSTHIWRNKERLGRKIAPSFYNPLTKKMWLSSEQA